MRSSRLVGRLAGGSLPIRAVHVQAGERDPCCGLVTMWVRRARNGLSTEPEAVAGELAGPARQVPTTGWPTCVFVRRDRLAFLVHHLAAIPACQLVELQTDDLTVTDRRMIEVKAAGTAGWVAESPKEPAVLCLACGLLRWWWVLSQVDRDVYREMATSLSQTTPRSDHVCANADRLVGRLQVPAGWPVFPAIDRWGNVASEPVPTMSVTGMETVLRDVASQRWAHATVRVPAPVDQKKETSDQEPAPTVVTPTEPLVTWTATRDGVAARAQARASLAGVGDRLDELDAAIDDLNGQVDQIMADHTDPA